MAFYLHSDIQEIADRLADDVERFAGKTILICGGAGFLGRCFTALFSHLNKDVLSRPCRLVVADNLITRGSMQSELQTENIRFVHHNIIEPLDIDEPIHFIIQAAGLASPYYYRMYPLETLEVATTGTKQILELGRRHKLEGLLFFSSSEIYGDPDAAHVPTSESYRGNVACLGPRACYDESKRLGETLCSVYHQVHGVPTRIVRPFNVYGPGMQETDYRVMANFTSRILNNKPLVIYGNGKQTRTFCYITDAILGFLQVLIHGAHGQPYNIGNPTPEVSMLDLAKRWEVVLGRSLEIQLSDYPDTYPADEPLRRCPDITKARAQLGFSPQIHLEEGLSRFYGWAKENFTIGTSASG
jgi:UDP-glucuronate decarboxylase